MITTGGWKPPPLDQIRRDWESMCLRMRLADLGVAAQARVAEPVRLDAAELTGSVGVPLFKQLLERNSGVVAEALGRWYGGSWTVRVRLDPRPPRPPEPMPPVDILVV